MTVKAAAFAALLMGSAFATAAHADLITNGNFSQSSYTTNTQFGTASDSNFTASQGVTGWTGNNGYNIYFTSAAASTTVNTTGQYTYTGNEKLRAAAPSPLSGGAFVGLDGDQTAGVQGRISQTVTGLTVGTTYQLDFYFGSAQLQSRTGATTETLAVTFGNQTINTTTLTNTTGGFTGWVAQSLTFTASATSQLLSFLSVGTPTGLPPMALLDDVRLNAVSTVPEPATLSIIGAGMVGLGLMRRRRKAA